MTWKQERGYIKYKERIKWMEWEIREKEKRITELEDKIQQTYRHTTTAHIEGLE